MLISSIGFIQLNAKDNTKEEEQIKQLKEKWESNPLSCYTDVSNNVIQKCAEKDQGEINIPLCQVEIFKKIKEICSYPTFIAIVNDYEKKTNNKIDKKADIKDLPKDFIKFMNDRIKIYQKQAVFFSGMSMGRYIDAIATLKTINKNNEKK